MPSTTSSSVSRLLASSTVITPSLPTFFIASARKRPISWSPLAEIVPTWAISSLDVTFLEFFLSSSTTVSTARSMPRLRSIGFMPAATALEPSLTIAAASTVAVVVPSPAMSEVLDATSRTIWAPIFSNLSSSSISLATVTPSLVMRGAPNDLSSTTLRPLGPSVMRTALASTSTPRSILSRASVENRTSFAAMSIHSWFCWMSAVPRPGPGRTSKETIRPIEFARSGEDPHHVGLLHDQELFAIEHDFGAGPFAEQDLVAALDVDRDQLAGLVTAAGADRDHFPLLGLFAGSIGNDDPAFGLRLGIDALHHHAVMEGPELG